MLDLPFGPAVREDVTCRSPGTLTAVVRPHTALCAGYLDWYATVLLRRLEGLSDAQVGHTAVPSGWSLLGLVQHSACVRRFWVRHVFSGEDVDFSWPGTAEEEWVPRPEDTRSRWRVRVLPRRARELPWVCGPTTAATTAARV